MKKVCSILILLAVIAGCVVAAGCTGTSSSTDIPEKVAYTITVEKDQGETYNVGDILALTFLTNPSTGYDWHIVKGKEILSKEFNDADRHPAGLVGAPSNVTFWFQAEKEGDYPIELVYAQSWDMANTTISTFSDVLHVKMSDLPNADGPKTSISFDSFDLNQKAGQFVKIVAPVNPTPKSSYSASGNGLTIKGNTQLANENVAGSKDVYTWYVTAVKPGNYTFRAVCTLAGSSEEYTAFTIPLKFD